LCEIKALLFHLLLFPLLTDKNNIFFSEKIFFSLLRRRDTHCEKWPKIAIVMRRFSVELSTIFISIFTEIFQLVSSVRPLMFASVFVVPPVSCFSSPNFFRQKILPKKKVEREKILDQNFSTPKKKKIRLEAEKLSDFNSAIRGARSGRL
jgi:hypothetical protein